MSAEYGRAAGGTINVNYRSGTNRFQGAGWEFLRNTAMNATGFFKPANGKPTLDKNQFGGVLGGPLVKNKAFFFGDYEGLRQTRKVTAISSIGRRSSARDPVGGLRDPRTGALFRGVPIPLTAFARKCSRACPTPPPRATNNYRIQEFTADSNTAAPRRFQRRRSSDVRTYGWRILKTSTIRTSLPSGARATVTLLRTSSSSSLDLYRRVVRARSAFRLFWPAGGKIPRLVRRARRNP